ncbi:MAG: hypothetical protein ISR65_11485 [Bacteriovoracaceae bacterium]|nr:hypothetical protein [Bacteriovoracaceae bacterium]
MKLASSFPFNTLVAQREQQFCNLQTSIILNQNLQRHSNLLQSIEDSKKLTINGEFTFESLNECVQAIEKHSYRYTKLQFMETIQSIASIFMEEKFSYLREMIPQFGDIIDKYTLKEADIEWMNNMLHHTFSKYDEHINELKTIDEFIQQMVYNLYGQTINHSKVLPPVDGIAAVVSSVAFFGTGNVIGNLFASNAFDSNAKLAEIHQCMEHIIHYVDKFDLMLDRMLASAGEMDVVFRAISDKLAMMEIKLYRDLEGKLTNVDEVFHEYYLRELFMLEQIYDSPLPLSLQPQTYRDMVNRINDVVAEYQPAMGHSQMAA